MGHDDTAVSELQAEVQQAAATDTPLEILGGGTKRFYGRAARPAKALTTHALDGVVHYEPSELFVTVRAGTRLADLDALLAREGQMLAFEPPHFGPNATVGGMVATGLSGPRRAWSGGVRDHLLGVRLLDGLGQVLHFGGEVMKNVAGYDLFRPMAGALGTLGVLLEVTLKLAPRPERTETRALALDPEAARKTLAQLWREPVPVTGTWYDGVTLYVRLAGDAPAVAHAARGLGGERLPEDTALWRDLREQRLPWFEDPRPLWRISVPPLAPELSLPGDWASEWCGGQRWLLSDAAPGAIRRAAAAAGGHATWFRGAGPGDEVFHPLPPPLLTLHRRLKATFDPKGLFNPGRLYAQL